jgi:hypothetical protein
MEHKTSINHETANSVQGAVIGSIKKPLQELKSYNCSLDGEHWETINALSSGQAKMRYYRDLDMDIPYTAIRCRVNGYPYTSEDFMRMAKYRQIEFAYCGMAVMVGDWMGVITGHNSSSNLNVLAVDGKYKGQVLNCHPHSEVTYFDRNGNVLRAF